MSYAKFHSSTFIKYWFLIVLGRNGRNYYYQATYFFQLKQKVRKIIIYINSVPPQCTQYPLNFALHNKNHPSQLWYICPGVFLISNHIEIKNRLRSSSRTSDIVFFCLFRIKFSFFFYFFPVFQRVWNSNPDSYESWVVRYSWGVQKIVPLLVSLRKPMIIIEVWLGHFLSSSVFKFLENDGSWRTCIMGSTKRPLFQLVGNSVREHVATLDLLSLSLL